MNIKELMELVPKEKREEAQKLIDGSNPLNALTDKTVGDFVTKNELLTKHLQSFADKRVTDGIETWKEKNLSKLQDDHYQERYNKEHPPETEDQKRLLALEQDNAMLKRDNKIKGQKATAQQVLGSLELPKGIQVEPNIVSALIREDENETKGLLDGFGSLLKRVKEEAIKETLADVEKRFGRKPIVDDPNQNVDLLATPAAIEDYVRKHGPGSSNDEIVTKSLEALNT